MSSIHFVERLENFQLVDEETNEWESGFWIVSRNSAQKLLDGDIYLHSGQNEPSFCGGIITGFRVVQRNEKEKVVFRFRRNNEHEGLITPSEGWGNEQKPSVEQVQGQN